MNTPDNEIDPKKRCFYHRDGKLYIDRKLERSIYMVLTLAVLIWGVLAKIGLVS